jgi:hypothetical protein
MAETTPATTLEMLTVEGNINTSDIVSIRLSQIEGQLNDRDAELTSQIKELDDQIRNADKELNAAIIKVATDKYKAKVDAAVAALNAIEGFEVKVDVTAHILGHDLEGDKISIGIRFRRQAGCLAKSSEVPVTDDVKAKQAKVKELEDQRDTVQNQAIEVRRTISKIGSIERQIRGKLAQAKLSESDTGKIILDRINSFEIKGLPKLD